MRCTGRLGWRSVSWKGGPGDQRWGLFKYAGFTMGVIGLRRKYEVFLGLRASLKLQDLRLTLVSAHTYWELLGPLCRVLRGNRQ